MRWYPFNILWPAFPAAVLCKGIRSKRLGVAGEPVAIKLDTSSSDTCDSLSFPILFLSPSKRMPLPQWSSLKDSCSTSASKRHGTIWLRPGANLTKLKHSRAPVSSSKKAYINTVLCFSQKGWGGEKREIQQVDVFWSKKGLRYFSSKHSKRGKRWLAWRRHQVLSSRLQPIQRFPCGECLVCFNRAGFTNNAHRKPLQSLSPSAYIL